MPDVKQPSQMRLNKRIAQAGICARRKADELIVAGKISVNGKVVTNLGYKVTAQDVVCYQDHMLSAEPLVYVLLNKPKDYLCTVQDTHQRNTVMDLVKTASPNRLYPVGRLDRNTTGLLLLTNDGNLAKGLSHPSSQVAKLYQVQLDKALHPNDFVALQQGVLLADGKVNLDDIAIVNQDATCVGVALHSGRNRVVRRLFEHLGYVVHKLDRTGYAHLTKKDLPRGKWRFLTPKEVGQLQKLVTKNIPKVTITQATTKPIEKKGVHKVAKRSIKHR